MIVLNFLWISVNSFVFLFGVINLVAVSSSPHYEYKAKSKICIASAAASVLAGTSFWIALYNTLKSLNIIT